MFHKRFLSDWQIGQKDWPEGLARGQGDLDVVRNSRKTPCVLSRVKLPSSRRELSDASPMTAVYVPAAHEINLSELRACRETARSGVRQLPTTCEIDALQLRAIRQMLQRERRHVLATRKVDAPKLRARAESLGRDVRQLLATPEIDGFHERAARQMRGGGVSGF